MKKFLSSVILLTTATVFMFTGCSNTTEIVNTAPTAPVGATPTPVPYEHASYYDTYPGISDVIFNTSNIQDLMGQEMPVYANGDEIEVSFATEVTTIDLLFTVEPIPYSPEDEVINPISEPITVTCIDRRYSASFTDTNECFLGYYMSFTDPETGIIYFDAIVACGDTSVIEQV